LSQLESNVRLAARYKDTLITRGSADRYPISSSVSCRCYPAEALFLSAAFVTASVATYEAKSEARRVRMRRRVREQYAKVGGTLPSLIARLGGAARQRRWRGTGIGERTRRFPRTKAEGKRKTEGGLKRSSVIELARPSAGDSLEILSLSCLTSGEMER